MAVAASGFVQHQQVSCPVCRQVNMSSRDVYGPPTSIHEAPQEVCAIACRRGNLLRTRCEGKCRIRKGAGPRVEEAFCVTPYRSQKVSGVLSAG